MEANAPESNITLDIANDPNDNIPIEIVEDLGKHGVRDYQYIRHK